MQYAQCNGRVRVLSQQHIGYKALRNPENDRPAVGLVCLSAGTRVFNPSVSTEIRSNAFGMVKICEIATGRSIARAYSPFYHVLYEPGRLYTVAVSRMQTKPALFRAKNHFDDVHNKPHRPGLHFYPTRWLAEAHAVLRFERRGAQGASALKLLDTQPWTDQHLALTDYLRAVANKLPSHWVDYIEHILTLEQYPMSTSDTHPATPVRS